MFTIFTALCGVSPVASQEIPVDLGHEALHHYESFYELIHPAEEKSDEAFVWLSDVPYFLFNAVMHFTCKEGVAEKVDDLIAKTPEGSPLSFWLHGYNRAEGLTQILQARGFESVIACPLMMCTIVQNDPTEADIRKADREAFDRITSLAFHFDPSIQEKYSALLDKTDGEFYLIYLDGKPVGTGLLLAHGEAGGIFNIATLPEYEGRGCASKMMKFLKCRAYQRGLKKLVLLSHPSAEKMYANLGFKRVLTIDIYARGS